MAINPLVSIRLDATQLGNVDFLAGRAGKARSDFIRGAVAQAVADAFNRLAAEAGRPSPKLDVLGA